MRPFTIDVPESELDDLRERLARTRWPETGHGRRVDPGVPLDYARELCEYWRTATTGGAARPSSTRSRSSAPGSTAAATTASTCT